MNKSKIEWCDYTWNPVTGCMHGCEYCYARRIAQRFDAKDRGVISEDIITENPKSYRGLYEKPFPHGFEPTLYVDRLIEPQKLKKPSKIFVVSMGDLFGEWVPDEWINEVMIAISKAPWHTYIILTKNPDRYHDYFNGPEKHNFNDIKIFWGTTITKQKDLSNIWPRTLHTLDFLSIEPLLGEVYLEPYLYDEHYDGYHTYEWKLKWCIIGQQTGPGAKPPKPEWVQSIIDQCRAAGVPVFVKPPLYKKFPIQEFPERM